MLHDVCARCSDVGPPRQGAAAAIFPSTSWRLSAARFFFWTHKRCQWWLPELPPRKGAAFGMEPTDLGQPIRRAAAAVRPLLLQKLCLKGTTGCKRAQGIAVGDRSPRRLTTSRACGCEEEERPARWLRDSDGAQAHDVCFWSYFSLVAPRVSHCGACPSHPFLSLPLSAFPVLRRCCCFPPG